MMKNNPRATKPAARGFLLLSKLGEELFLHFFAEAVQHSSIGEVDHGEKLVFRETVKQYGVPIGLLNRRAVISPHDLSGVERSVEITHVGGAFQCELIILLIWI